MRGLQVKSRNPIIAPWPVGARGGLIDEKHRKAMGEAVFLFMWCLLRQTGQHDGWGIVLYGKTVTYDFIHGETGFAFRTLQRWMAILVGAGYLHVEHVQRGMVIRIAKAKKWGGDTTVTASGKTVKNTKKRVSCLATSGDPASPHLATHSTKSGDPEVSAESQSAHKTADIGKVLDPNVQELLLKVNSTKLRHDAGASGAPTFSTLVKNTELPGKKPLTSTQTDERRRLLLAQAAKIKRDYPSARTA